MSPRDARGAAIVLALIAIASLTVEESWGTLVALVAAFGAVWLLNLSRNGDADGRTTESGKEPRPPTQTGDERGSQAG